MMPIMYMLTSRILTRLRLPETVILRVQFSTAVIWTVLIWRALVGVVGGFGSCYPDSLELEVTPDEAMEGFLTQEEAMEGFLRYVQIFLSPYFI